MPKALLVRECPAPQLVCSTCDALFLHCRCHRQHSATYLEGCRLCTAQPEEEDEYVHP